MEECNEIEGIVQERNMNWTRHEEDSMKGQSLGDETQLDKYQKVVEGLEKLEQKLKEQEERETQEKEEKARLRSRGNSERKQSRKRVMHVNQLPKHVITKFNGTHLEGQRL